MKTILEKLEENANLYPNKVIFSDINKSYTYKSFVESCKSLAVYFLEYKNKPIAVFDNRNVDTLVAMVAILYSGNYYVVIDSASPAERIDKIYDVLKPVVSILQDKNRPLYEGLTQIEGKVFYIDQTFEVDFDDRKIEERQKCLISTDPAYILFTSGSTGVPKGTVVSHLNILSYIDWYVNQFNINTETIFGSQTSFYFSMSVSDIFSTIYAGATLNIIPRSFFTFLPQCVEFLNQREVNTIYWVPSALCLFANLKMLDYAKIEHLKLIMFAGEPMPNKQLNYWRKHIENAKYVNLFGPTETTDICTFYEVNREFRDDEPLPIGVHCDNCDTFVIDEDGNEVTEKDKLGQLYARGPFVAYGYFNNPEKTHSAFVQNPLNKSYPEIVYRTGDLVKINRFGEYEYAGRIDFQIKHKGYRIELGEIETAVYGVDKIQSAVCIFDQADDAIVLIYTGRVKEADLLSSLSNKVPEYMVPNIVIRASELPYNANGKIDRSYLMNNYKAYLNLGRGD